MLNNLPISVQDISVVLEILFIVYVMFFMRGKYRYTYGKYIYISILFVLTSSLMANYSYSQPLWYGIRAQRHWICAMLMYFPISKLIKNGKITKENLLGMLDFMNIIYIVLVVLQFFLGTRVQFLSVGTSERYGSIRLYVELTYILVSYYMHLLRLITTKGLYRIDIFFVVATLFINIAVTKSRMGIVTLMIATALAILSIKFTMKKLFLVLGLLIIVIAFFYSNIGQDILTLVFNPSKSIGGDTSEIRELGRRYYIESASKEWSTLLFGCGFVNIDWPQSVAGSGYNLQYYYNDNGMFGLFFYYGITFVIWSAVLYLKLLKNSWKYTRMFFFLLLADIIGSYSLIPIIYSTTIGFALICAIVEECMINNVVFNEEELIGPVKWANIYNCSEYSIEQIDK